mmetsp:Transcript_18047/g.50067  ORF Transcript_18047/g.50067 Transcript_18047/m.50067 type:complete len:87 (-) Transcript_18047:530-790(-)
MYAIAMPSMASTNEAMVHQVNRQMGNHFINYMARKSHIFLGPCSRPPLSIYLQASIHLQLSYPPNHTTTELQYEYSDTRSIDLLHC